MYRAPSSGHEVLNLNLPFKLIPWRFSDVWSENTALFERLVEICSNPPIHVVYFVFKKGYNMVEMRQKNQSLLSSLASLQDIPIN